jgi:hypothetical protein
VGTVTWRSKTLKRKTDAPNHVGSGDWLGSNNFIKSTLLTFDKDTDDTQERSANHHEYPRRSDHKCARRSVRANETQNIRDDLQKADCQQNETNHNQNNLECLWFHNTLDAA